MPLRRSRARGKLRILFQPPKDAESAALWKSFLDYKGMDVFVAAFNAHTVLPQDLPIVFIEGKGDMICEYHPNQHTIVVSYEMLKKIHQLMFAASTASPAKTALFVNAAMHFALMHEIGHAFIHEFNIPATGRQEDDADQFASLFLLSAKGYDGVPIAAAAFFGLMQKESGVPGLKSYADVHPLDMQRCYNLLTWAYGSNPQMFGDFVKGANVNLPPERAQGAPREWQQMKKSWETLLDKYVPNEKGHIEAPAPPKAG